jgi:FKBP-type peptidyl-prolyl cis-trans isomerase (trigger factor)
MQTKKDKRKNAEVSITGALSKEKVAAEFDKTLARIAKEVEIQGFRKGKAPLDKVREYVGEKALWREAAETALNHEVESILKEHEVLPIMPVGASLSAADADADVAFEIIAVTAPTCSIDGYKETAEKAAAKVEKTDEAKEKQDAMNALRAQARAMVQSTGEGELTDEEAKKVGFENAKAFEFFLGEEAERAVRERQLQIKRGAIAEALIAKGACDIPRVLINQEAGQLLDVTKKDIAAQGLPFNDYLKQTGKTEDKIREELEAPAEKRVALDIIFGEIARKEEIKTDEKEEERLAHALVNQGVDHETAHRYVKNVVIREKVWEILGAKSNSPFSTKEESSEEKPAA